MGVKLGVGPFLEVEGWFPNVGNFKSLPALPYFLAFNAKEWIRGNTKEVKQCLGAMTSTAV